LTVAKRVFYGGVMQASWLGFLQRLHAHVSTEFAASRAANPERFQCANGCSGCCQDGLTVFKIEAELIREVYGPLLRSGAAHPLGACAFLDENKLCRIYDVRPLVCRTQGAVLSYSAPDSEQEERSVCALNDDGSDITQLPDSLCLDLGPPLEVLAHLQQNHCGTNERVALRELFGSESVGEALVV
jgi:hypothetical protein